MQLEEVDIRRGDARHLIGPLCREIRRRKEERIPAAVYRNRIGGIGRPGHDNPRLPRPGDHLICRDNDDRSRRDGGELDGGGRVVGSAICRRQQLNRRVDLHFAFDWKPE